MKHTHIAPTPVPLPIGSRTILMGEGSQYSPYDDDDDDEIIIRWIITISKVQETTDR